MHKYYIDFSIDFPTSDKMYCKLYQMDKNSHENINVSIKKDIMTTHKLLKEQNYFIYINKKYIPIKIKGEYSKEKIRRNIIKKRIEYSNEIIDIKSDNIKKF